VVTAKSIGWQALFTYVEALAGARDNLKTERSGEKKASPNLYGGEDALIHKK